MTVPFNINDYVHVRLTPKGRQIHRANHDDLVAKIGGLPLPYIPVVENMEGWSRWQAWDLMRVFGPHLYNGCVLPFETTIKVEPREL